MRIIIHGVGAIGGTLAAELARAGVEVVGIARGRMLQAIKADGLTLHTPLESYNQAIKVVSSPDEVAFRDDDVILLTMQTQDTGQALTDLRNAGAMRQPIFCFQNGVANERMALRVFPNVYAVTVMLPANYLQPGVVVANCQPRYGMFDIGRYPFGLDDTVAELCTALERANFKCFPTDAPMASKYGKLIMNLGNLMNAALGQGVDQGELRKSVRAEGEAAFAAAGIDWRDVGMNDPSRTDTLTMTPVEGQQRAGSSTAQSLMRATGSIETDYLNGEISLLGRLHGVPTPLNDGLVRLSRRFLNGEIRPGSMTLERLLAELGN